MRTLFVMHRFFYGLVLFTLSVWAAAQSPVSKVYEPKFGQAGKDVVWVPLPDEQVEKLLDMAKVTPADFVIDLGSGDGRTVIAAAKRGARALGVEFNPDLVAYSKREAEKAGLSGRAAFVQGDLFQTDMSRATVITLFLLESMNVKLQPALLALKPGTRIVANSFGLGEWEPDVYESHPPECETWCAFYLWFVPARVDGVWRTPEGEFRVQQRFQTFAGTLGAGALALPVLEGRLAGEQIRFRAGGAEYRGRLSGNVIEGTVATGAGIRPWRASR